MRNTTLIVLEGHITPEQRQDVVNCIYRVAQDYDGDGPSKVSFTWDLSLDGGQGWIYVWSRNLHTLVSASRQLSDTLPGFFSVCDSETEDV